MIYKDTITVYNVIPQRGREPERLQRTVIRGVFWDGSFGISTNKTGSAAQDNVLLIIPNSDIILPYHEWIAADMPPDKCTLHAGDFILLGEHGDISSAAEAANLSAEQITVSTVRDCRYGSRNLWHWEVTGK